ncbi:MAG TPA: hypothetical protein VJR27_02990 [Candidatus Saccharimonadales bacterium]|nr:hypothetical protein [Candidatus Saccharimonadales bacterium]
MDVRTLFAKLASVLVLTIAAATLLFAGYMPGRAAAATPAPAGGQAFSIAPPLLNLKADPGQTVMARILLTNVSSGPMIMSAAANDFAAKDESGNPNIILNTKDPVPFSLRNFIQLPAQFTLGPKETKTLDVPIVVPHDAEPGGHYGVIRFTGASPDVSGTGVSLSASIGTLILLQVSGNIQERASLADFYAATPNNFAKKSFFQTGPVGFVARISNDGNTHIQPSGTLTIKNTIGKQVASLRVNGTPNNPKDPPKNILPGSIRRFQLTLNQKWLFGRYTAHFDVTYDNKHLVANQTFWVVPYAIVLPVLVGLVVVAFALRYGIKKYNAHIIKKSKAAAAEPENPDSSNTPTET